MQTIEIGGKKYEVKEHDANGVPTIRGYATTVKHTDENGKQILDKDGHPKVSVHVSVSPVQEAIEETN